MKSRCEDCGADTSTTDKAAAHMYRVGLTSIRSARRDGLVLGVLVGGALTFFVVTVVVSCEGLL